MKNITLTLAILFSFGLFLSLEGCKTMKSENQGVKGTVTWLEGNQMPTIRSDEDISDPSTEKKGKPVVRVIKVYPLTKLSDTKMENGLFQSISGEPITEVISNENGEFTLNLSPGSYSLFTVEEDGLFANSFDGNGNIEPLLIKKGEWVTRDLVINYKAYF